MSFIFPSHEQTFKDTILKSNISFSDSSSAIHISPLLDLEVRQLEEHQDRIQASGFGGIIFGKKSLLSFMIDARIYSEYHSNDKKYSYDREYVELQKEGENSSSTFISYSRYRANFNLNLPFGDLGYSRTSVHWGPGLIHNLVFNKDAVPFHHFYYTGRIGPIKVMSLWGELSIDGKGDFRGTNATRSVYGHRYEWCVSNNLLLGISEMLILYDTEEPSAFIPIIPLFMEKGQGLEDNNNGNLAFDIAYRVHNLGLIYSEFLIDDLSEPTSLFNNFWKNKWAWMFGVNIHKTLDKNQIGYIMEYSRIEPWVYTHYVTNTAQAANHGYPLGNQLGPNSQAFTNKIYIRNKLSWYFGIRLDLYWKGTDYGSSLDDHRANHAKQSNGTDFTKIFIDNIAKPDIVFTPEISYSTKYYSISSKIKVYNSKFDYFLRLLFIY